MISTLGTVPKPSFLTLIASIRPYKPFQRHTRLWPSRPRLPPASQKFHYQTPTDRPPNFVSTPPPEQRVSTCCSRQQRRLFHFQRPELQYKARAVIFRYSSSSPSSRNAGGNEPNKNKQQRDSLPSEDEGQRSNLSKKFSHLMDNVQSNIFFAGQRLNDLTGYSGIEALKRDIEEQGRSALYFIYIYIFLSIPYSKKKKILSMISNFFYLCIREESSNYPYFAPAMPTNLLGRNIPTIDLSARGQ